MGEPNIQYSRLDGDEPVKTGTSMPSPFPTAHLNPEGTGLSSGSGDRIELSEYPTKSTFSSGLDLEDDSVVGAIVQESRGKSNMYMAFMNMANSILGAGVVGQSFAIKNCGLLGGLVLTMLLTLIVDWTIRLIIINLKLTGKTTYQDTVEFAMGRPGKFAVLFANGMFAFGGCVGFCIIIGDSIPHVLRAFFPNHISYFNRNLIISIVTIFVSYPLSLNRNISKLSKASMLALVSLLLIVVIVVVRGPTVSNDYKGSFELDELFVTPRLFQGISVISFALVCHHNTSFIYFSLRKPSLRRFNSLTHISCIISMVVCLIAGYSGFLTFKSKTKGNILNNFPSTDNYINFARFCFGFNMLTTFPLEIFVLRDVIRDLISVKAAKDEPPKLSTRSHFIITTGLVLSTMGISLTTCNLGALLELVGSTTASLSAYILPPMTNLILTGERRSVKEKLPHYACILFGFSIMIISSTQTIITAMYSDKSSQCDA
ncbi:AaceriAFR671Wp [[Ashbya] aceris (nom. inval.)]|nr:AaceriAFR671Wp [[Ashbya] aceris (nom. inval.)]